ncbi:MAG: hypothetical protein WBN11_05805 [Eudoraea sp.]|uniref:hypothetical protein n=1 Tax=Eudoraea sp. TaxID=1979955 RepID=UPI003C738935
MRISIIFLVITLMTTLSCSNDSSTENALSNEQNISVQYSLLQINNDIVSATNIDADGENIQLDLSASSFTSMKYPTLSSLFDGKAMFYEPQNDCSGELVFFSLKNGEFIKFNVFEDSKNCDREVIAITGSGNTFFVLYEIPGDFLKEVRYYLRVIDSLNPLEGYEDFEIENYPSQLTYLNNRLFVLTEDLMEENHFLMLVFDLETKSWLSEMNLGNNVERLISTSENNLLITYPELHNLYSASTMEILSTTRYLEGTEPNFGKSSTHYFAPDGKLYFTMPTDLEGTKYAHIPAVYDFERNTASLYYYENFLTQEEQNYKYEIGNTTVLSYDSKNNLMLIGYQKSLNKNLGGIIRIKPSPNPKLIDHIDLNGVPIYIYTE